LARPVGPKSPPSNCLRRDAKRGSNLGVSHPLPVHVPAAHGRNDMTSPQLISTALAGAISAPGTQPSLHPFPRAIVYRRHDGWGADRAAPAHRRTGSRSKIRQPHDIADVVRLTRAPFTVASPSTEPGRNRFPRFRFRSCIFSSVVADRFQAALKRRCPRNPRPSDGAGRTPPEVAPEADTARTLPTLDRRHNPTCEAGAGEHAEHEHGAADGSANPAGQHFGPPLASFPGTLNIAAFAVL
jgi:hypothetical protein